MFKDLKNVYLEIKITKIPLKYKITKMPSSNNGDRETSGGGREGQDRNKLR